MISFTLETQRPVCWISVTSCFVLLGALCCCNGVLHQKTVKMTDPLQSTSESSRMPDTTKQLESAALDLGSLLDARDGAVVTLVAGDTKLAVHRAVLAVGSPILAAMFRPDTLEATSSEFDIPDVEGPVLRQLVAFLYTGRATLLPSMALQLLAAASKYGVSALQDASEQQVLKHLDVESAAAVAVVAVRHSCHSLRKAVIAFIKAHIFEVLGTHGWAEAVVNKPREVVQIYCVLTEPPAHTSTTATADSTTTSTATTTAAPTTPDMRPTPTAAAPTATTAIPATTGSTPTSTAATSAIPTSCHYTQPPNATAVSFFRGLPANEKFTRLRWASIQGAVQELRALLAAGADVRARDWDKMTALHHAALKGHVAAAQCLLLAGAEVNARTSGQETPLLLAAAKRHMAEVRLLLAASADPNARNSYGWTPLHMATFYKHVEVVAALLQARADRTVKSHEGETALDIARVGNHPHLIQMLQ